jgi:hypothetical protein
VKAENKETKPPESIEEVILLIRGQKVILDYDLAEIYGVETRRLNEQVRRNAGRFPPDFMFQLTAEEFVNLKSHFAISSLTWGGRRKLPQAFTEHGAIMAASILNSPKAVEMSVFVVRAFIRLCALLAAHKELALKMTELERTLTLHDKQILSILDAIKRLMAPPAIPKRKIGFNLKEKQARYGRSK